MKKLLSLVGLFVLTAFIGVAISGVVAENAGACYSCGYDFSCPSGQTCLPAAEPGIRFSVCQDGCCQFPTPYVYFECDGYCSGSILEFPTCDCHKAGCWAGIPPHR